MHDVGSINIVVFKDGHETLQANHLYLIGLVGFSAAPSGKQRGWIKMQSRKQLVVGRCMQVPKGV